MLTQPIQNIIDQISRYQTQQAQNSINQLIQREKKKQKLSPQELQQLPVLMAQVQVMEKQFGEAQQFLEAFVNSGQVDSALMFLITNVAKELDLLRLIPKLMPQMNQKDQLNDLYHLFLEDHNFAEASKYALKLFKVGGEKDHFLMFSYIFLNAESQPTNKGGKITSMFIDKLSKSINFDKQKPNFEGCVNVNLAQQIVKLELELCKSLKDFPTVKLILLNHEKLFSQYQDNLEHLKWLQINEPSCIQYKYIIEINMTSYVESNLQLLQTHLKQGGLFTQNFEAQQKFIDFLITGHTDLTLPIVVTQEQPFSISAQSDSKDILIHIYNSCYTLMQTVEDPTIIRSLVLTFLYIVNQTHPKESDQSLKIALKIFNRYHGNKFSYIQEVFHALSQLNQKRVIDLVIEATEEDKQLQQLTRSQLESQLIRELNQSKIKALNHEQNVLHKSTTSELLRSYNQADRKLYPDDHVVEKGDRLLQDDYLLMILDMMFDKVLQAQRMESQESMHNCIMSLLIIEIGLLKSPYNFDFLMRQNQIYCMIGCADSVIDTSVRLDIKSGMDFQFDTVGFLFAKASLEFGVSHDILERRNLQALSFYQENLRDSKKNLITCTKQQNFNSFSEFHRFEDWIKESYLWLIYLYVQTTVISKQTGKSEQSKAINNEWIYNKIKKQLNKQQLPQEDQISSYSSPLPYLVLQGGKPTFSISGQLFQTQSVRDLPANQGQIYFDYLGLYQNPKMLLLEVQFCQIEIVVNQVLKDPSPALKQMIDEAESLLKVFKLDDVTDIQPHFQVPKEQGSFLKMKQPSVLSNELEDQFKYQSIYKISFAQSNFNFQLCSSKLLLEFSHYTDGSNNISQGIINLQQQFTDIVHTLTAQAQNFSPVTHFIPSNLLKKIHRFYIKTFSYALILVANQEEIKNRLFKLAKKAQEDVKKTINEHSKQYTSFMAYLQDQLKGLSKILIDKLSLCKDSYTSVISAILDQLGGEQMYVELKSMNQINIEKTYKIFTENLSSALSFQCVKQISLIEERERDRSRLLK